MCIRDRVNAGHAVEVLVQGLAGVLFQVRAGNADALAAAVFQVDIEVAVMHDGQLELADLVTLGEIRVKVVLASEHRARGNAGVGGQAEHGRHAYHFRIQYR